jgi:hypothetical protein
VTRYGIGRGPLKKVDGKRYPVVAEVVVRLSHDLELYALDGTKFVRPQHEARLHVSIERDGKEVALGTVALADVLRKLDDPACPDAPEDDPDELAFQEELRQWVSAG